MSVEREYQSVVEVLMPDGYPAIERVAEHIGSSVRTLQRRLSEAGLTHTVLVEHARREMALRQLKTTRLPIGQVAKELGFRDPSSFSRAFQRWTGMSPRAYRRMLQQTALGIGQKQPNDCSTDH
ncbi:MAG: helix-turn-helix transcriptional regulator [Sedimenticolaceae bacterium]